MTEAGGRLLLDVDGVLVTPPEMFGERLFKKNPDVAAEFFYGPFMDASRGRSDLRDVLPAYLERSRYAGTPDQFLLDGFSSENHPNLPLGWPTPSSPPTRSATAFGICSKTGSSAHSFGGEFSSARVGTRKPDPAYFAEVTRRLNIPPGQIVFWDDAQVNVTAAAGAGWQAHLFTGAAHFRAVMALAARP